MENGLAMMGLALWQRLTASVVHHRNMWLSTTTTMAMTTGAEICVSRSRVAGLLMMMLLTMWSFTESLSTGLSLVGGDSPRLKTSVG